MILLPPHSKYDVGTYYLKYSVAPSLENDKTKQQYAIFKYDGIFTTILILEVCEFHISTTRHAEVLIYELTEDEIFNNITMVEIVENL